MIYSTQRWRKSPPCYNTASLTLTLPSFSPFPPSFPSSLLPPHLRLGSRSHPHTLPPSRSPSGRLLPRPTRPALLLHALPPTRSPLPRSLSRSLPPSRHPFLALLPAPHPRPRSLSLLRCLPPARSLYALLQSPLLHHAIPPTRSPLPPFLSPSIHPVLAPLPPSPSPSLHFAPSLPPTSSPLPCPRTPTLSLAPLAP
jgi:hypothetical protein